MDATLPCHNPVCKELVDFRVDQSCHFTVGSTIACMYVVGVAFKSAEQYLGSTTHPFEFAAVLQAINTVSCVLN